MPRFATFALALLFVLAWWHSAECSPVKCTAGSACQVSQVSDCDGGSCCGEKRACKCGVYSDCGGDGACGDDCRCTRYAIEREREGCCHGHCHCHSHCCHDHHHACCHHTCHGSRRPFWERGPIRRWLSRRCCR